MVPSRTGACPNSSATELAATGWMWTCSFCIIGFIGMFVELSKTVLVLLLYLLLCDLCHSCAWPMSSKICYPRSMLDLSTIGRELNVRRKSYMLCINYDTSSTICYVGMCQDFELNRQHGSMDRRRLSTKVVKSLKRLRDSTKTTLGAFSSGQESGVDAAHVVVLYTRTATLLECPRCTDHASILLLL